MLCHCRRFMNHWHRPMNPPPEVTGFYVSFDKSKLNVPWICAQLRAQYWGGWLTDDKIMTAMKNSLCFGAYIDDVMDSGELVVCGQQIGFARVLTDGSCLSAVTDVVVDERFRNRGIGSSLMRAVTEHGMVDKTICILQARPLAQEWYGHWNFQPCQGVMKRDPK